MVRVVPRFLSRCGVWIMTGRSSSLASSSCARRYLSSSGGLLVVADLADGDDAFLGGEARQDLHHRLGQRLVVRLLGVEADGAVVADAELAGAEPLEADDGGQVVDIGADIGARLAEPEGGLDDGDDAGARHRLVVVGGARDHVDVRIDEHGAAAAGTEALTSSATRCELPLPAASASREPQQGQSIVVLLPGLRAFRTVGVLV